MAHIFKRSPSKFVVRSGEERQHSHEAENIADAVLWVATSGEFVTFSPAAAEELATLVRIAKSATATVDTLQRLLG